MMDTRHHQGKIELRDFVDFDDDDRNVACPRSEKRPGISVFDIRISNEAELAVYNQTPILFNIERPETGAIDIVLSGVSCRWFGVWRLASNSGFHATANAGALDDVTLIQLAMQGRATHGGWARAHVAAAGFGCIQPFRDIQDGLFSPGYESINCVLRTKPLLRQMYRLNAENASNSSDFQPVAELNTSALQSFQQSLHIILDRLTKAGSGAIFADPLVEDILIGQLLGSWPREAAQAMTARPASSRHVQRSVDFIEAHLAVPISVTDVATAAGVGVRALQSSFRKDLGRTPIQYIIDRRLEQVHDELRRGGSTSISSIALRWGFVHMSDFSRRYRQRFGCTPSETQIRAGHVGP